VPIVIIRFPVRFTVHVTATRMCRHLSSITKTTMHDVSIIIIHVTHISYNICDMLSRQHTPVVVY